MLPVAVDAMGGDHAPDAIVAGALLAAEAGIPVALVGPADLPLEESEPVVGTQTSNGRLRAAVERALNHEKA